MTTEADRILALAAEATPGPWQIVARSGGGGMPHYGVGGGKYPHIPSVVYAEHDRQGYGNGSRQSDAAFIAEVRTLAPVVAEQVKALEAQLAEVAEGRREYQHRALMAEERIENALARHKNVGGECNECIQVDEYELVEGKPWPCLTVQALTSETEASDE